MVRQVMIIKWRQAVFWSKRLYNPFIQKFGLKEQFESSDYKSGTKDYRTKNTNIKEVSNYGNGQVAYLDVETFDITGDDALQCFVS